MAALGLGLTGCWSPSEHDRAMAAERAALAAEQNQIVAGTSGCPASELRAWREAHAAEIAASDAWWSGLNGFTQGTLQGDHPDIGASGQSRGRLLISCGSAGDLWDSGS